MRALLRLRAAQNNFQETAGWFWRAHIRPYYLTPEQCAWATCSHATREKGQQSEWESAENSPFVILIIKLRFVTADSSTHVKTDTSVFVTGKQRAAPPHPPPPRVISACVVLQQYTNAQNSLFYFWFTFCLICRQSFLHLLYRSGRAGSWKRTPPFCFP